MKSPTSPKAGITHIFIHPFIIKVWSMYGRDIALASTRNIVKNPIQLVNNSIQPYVNLPPSIRCGNWGFVDWQSLIIRSEGESLY